MIYKNKITNKFMDIVRQTELQTDNLLTDKITDRELQSRVTDRNSFRHKKCIKKKASIRQKESWSER